MISSRLHAIADNGALTIRISGPMDLLLTWALRECCQDAAATYSRYIVDFQDVSIVRDSGLALLLMLKRLANRTGATLHVINGSTDLMQRCIKLGIQPAWPEPAQGPNLLSRCAPLTFSQGRR